VPINTVKLNVHVKIYEPEIDGTSMAFCSLLSFYTIAKNFNKTLAEQILGF